MAPKEIELLEAALHLPALVCRLLHARGVRDAEAAKRYLRPRLDQLHAARSMRDLPEAVDRLVRAVRDGETILVHGDYDVDGICSTTILTKTIRALGGRAIPFIPRRVQDGYDLTDAGVAAALAAGARVVVTCDCGTSALAPIAALCVAGVDVIVTDHHLPGGEVPSCLAVLNPKRLGCEYPDKDLAAAGLAFKLALALCEAFGAPTTPVLRMLDLVALATVADIAPLRGENRILVRYGLRLMAESPNIGLRALIRAAGLDGKTITAGRIGFILAPRLNAVGRLGHALRGVELLMTESESEANGIARELEELNRRRQEIDRATLALALQQVDALDLDNTYGIVLAGEGWHPGVIGIVASRVVEDTGRPALLIAVEGAEGKGSGRSIPALDLHGALSQCRDLLKRFGGHRAAAGITIAAENIPAFAERFNEVARSQLSADDLVPSLRIDAEVRFEEASGDLEALLRHFEPFGMGNAAPVLLCRGVRLAASPRVIGTDGLKLVLQSAHGTVQGIGWGLAPLGEGLAVGDAIDLVFRLERDEYNGISRLQAKIIDLHR